MCISEWSIGGAKAMSKPNMSSQVQKDKSLKKRSQGHMDDA